MQAVKHSAAPITSILQLQKQVFTSVSMIRNECSSIQNVKALLFDLDGTLYNKEKYSQHWKERVFQFMHDKLGVEKERCRPLWEHLFNQAGQTLKGLRTVGGFQFDVDEYWDYIREGHEQFLKPDSDIIECLQLFPGFNKWVFTNCNEKNAIAALKTLEIDEFFNGVIGADAMGEFCKPDIEAFQIAFDRVGVEAEHCIFFEDSLRNLKVAKEIGMKTILVIGYAKDFPKAEEIPEFVDGVVHMPIHKEISQIFPQLFAN